MEPASPTAPLRRRLFLLAAVALLPVAMMSAVALVLIFQQQREQAERTALEFTRALATAIDAELKRSIAVLEVLADSAVFEGGERAVLEQRLRRAAAMEDGWRSVILADAAGRQLLNTRFAPGRPLPATVDAQSLRETVERRRPVVGYLARGPAGEWALPLRVPVLREGRAQYVLTAVLRPEWLLEAVTRHQRLPEGWVVTVAEAKGLRILRSPGQARSIGTPISATLRTMAGASTPEGTGLATTTEGDAVHTAFRRLPELGWVVATGIPKGQVEAAGWRSLATLGGGVLLSVLAGLAAALALARGVNRPMGELRDAARALGRGEEPRATRTDIREIEEVGRALLAAAEQRRIIEAEREDLLRRSQSARAEAEAANRAKDEFLAMLGHELRNPLGAVSNAATLLCTPQAPQGARDKAIAVINRQVGHLARLTDDLLDASRALTGKIVLRRGPVNLAAAAAHTLSTLRAAGKVDRHKVFFEELGEAWADVDPIRFDQIVTNLLVNAAKYTPFDGTIRISVDREADEGVLRIADTGIGFSPELEARAFDIFVQGDRDLDRAQGGLGIGLTLVRRLAELHGGSVTLRSDGPGKGSEFCVRLPAIERPAHPEPRAPSGTPGARRVLVVEDHEDARETLRILLEHAGHRVDVAADGEEGLRKAADAAYEAILLDIGLPGLNGYEVARRLRALNGPRPCLIAITGYGTPDDRQRALGAGFDVHLVKPVDFQLLEETLAALPGTHARAAAAVAEPGPVRA